MNTSTHWTPADYDSLTWRLLLGLNRVLTRHADTRRCPSCTRPHSVTVWWDDLSWGWVCRAGDCDYAVLTARRSVTA